VPDLAQIVASSWQKIGVTATIINMDWTAFKKIRDFSMTTDMQMVGRAMIGALTVRAYAPKGLSDMYAGIPQGGNYNMLWNGKAGHSLTCRTSCRRSITQLTRSSCTTSFCRLTKSVWSSRYAPLGLPGP